MIGRYILRILAVPFIFGIVAIKYIYYMFVECRLFMLHGGESIIYRKETRETVKNLLDELEIERQEREKDREYLKENPPFGAPYDTKS